jgi:hypothetical protein
MNLSVGDEPSTDSNDPTDQNGTTPDTDKTPSDENDKAEKPDIVYSTGLAYAPNPDGKTCTVTGVGTCTDTSIYVPEQIDGYKVTAIGESAFASSKTLKSIYLPDGLELIGEYAFASCRNLDNIRVPDSIKIVANNALSGTDDLNFKEYDAADYIGNDENPYLVLVRGTSEVEKISPTTKVIYNGAFSRAYEIEELTLPEGLTYIGGSAFYGCIELKKINIPSTLIGIGRKIFEFCDKLEYTEHENGQYLGNDQNPYMMLYKAPEGEIKINENTKIIYSDAFAMNETVTTVEVPDNVICIADAAFISCSALVSVTLPSGLDVISENLFAGCSSLKEITLPEGIKQIGQNAFWLCESLESVVIPNGTVYIGAEAFKDCTSLSTLTIPSSVTSTGINAFENDTALHTVYFDGTLLDWLSRDTAYYSCPTAYGADLYIDGQLLTEAVIPEEITAIGDFVFSGC